MLICSRLSPKDENQWRSSGQVEGNLICCGWSGFLFTACQQFKSPESLYSNRKVQNAASAKRCCFKGKHAPNIFSHNEGHLCVSGTREGHQWTPLWDAAGELGLEWGTKPHSGRAGVFWWPCWRWMWVRRRRNRPVGLHQRNRWLHFQQHLLEPTKTIHLWVQQAYQHDWLFAWQQRDFQNKTQDFFQFVLTF